MNILFQPIFAPNQMKIKCLMKATVLYYSRRGKTAGYAREIAMYLWSKGLDVSLSSLTDYDPEKLSGTDFLFTGCWTCGWFASTSSLEGVQPETFGSNTSRPDSSFHNI